MQVDKTVPSLPLVRSNMQANINIIITVWVSLSNLRPFSIIQAPATVIYSMLKNVALMSTLVWRKISSTLNLLKALMDQDLVALLRRASGRASPWKLWLSPWIMKIRSKFRCTVIQMVTWVTRNCHSNWPAAYPNLFLKYPSSPPSNKHSRMVANITTHKCLNSQLTTLVRVCSNVSMKS